MTTTEHYTGTTQAFNLATLPPEVDICQLMRDEAAQRPGAAPCWVIHNGGESPELTVGLRGEVGALIWEEPIPGGPLAGYFPAEGSNAEHVDYFLGNRDHSPLPPGCELPAERVLAAVAEYARTGQRPTCVEWCRED